MSDATHLYAIALGSNRRHVRFGPDHRAPAEPVVEQRQDRRRQHPAECGQQGDLEAGQAEDQRAADAPDGERRRVGRGQQRERAAPVGVGALLLALFAFVWHNVVASGPNKSETWPIRWW